MIKLFDGIFYVVDELMYLGVLGVKQPPAEVHLMELKWLRRGEVSNHTLHNKFVVDHGSSSNCPCFLSKQFKELSYKEVFCHHIKFRVRGQVLTLDYFPQEDEELH